MSQGKGLRLRLIIPTSTLIILDITKTESNIVLLYTERKKLVLFLPLYRRHTRNTQPAKLS